MHNTILWNCRGVRKKETGHILREWIGKYDVGVIGLFETKVEALSRREVDRIAGRRWESFHLPAVGKSGGIAVLWRSDIIALSVRHATSQCVVGDVTFPDKSIWRLIFVYASKDRHTRRLLWQLLLEFSEFEGPVIAGGDFNCILRAEDKKGGRPFSYTLGSREMEEALIQSPFQELGFSGPAFTWCNNQPERDRVWTRLDRVWANDAVLESFPLAGVRHLPRVASDHCPLLVQMEERQVGPNTRWLKFEDTWLSYPACDKLVRKNWTKADHGSSAEVLARKCQRTLRALYFWSKTTTRELGRAKTELERDIYDLQVLECSEAGLSAEESSSLICKVKELNATLSRLESWWKQRAKVRWITEGDANSHYFHSIASSRRRSNRISHIAYDGQAVIEDPLLVEQEFITFFSQKWTCSRPQLQGWPTLPLTQRVSDAMSAELLREVSVAEIWAAVQALKGNRSPGWDGITASFLQKFWPIVRSEVCQAVLEFFSTGVMPPQWKETLVILVPKHPNAARPDLFRPISLCITVYKVVAKIIVGRLQHHLPGLISEEQGAFVPGRSISHHCLIAQEVMHKMKVSTAKSGILMAKIDMAQAYDKMSWDSLRQALTWFGFPPLFAQWILQCVQHPRFSILLNGSRTDWIAAECGFRQGCPLSPYIFILVAELLSCILREQGSSIGVSLKPGGPRLTHLLYADDILLFSEVSTASVAALRRSLDVYCSWTGQQINHGKSMVAFSKATPSWKANRFTRQLGFARVQELQYLGTTLAMRKLRAADFAGLLLRVNGQIRSWGNRHLSMAGRATLISSSLLPMAMFAMTHADIPAASLQAVDARARFFLWQKDHSHRGLHYVEWSKVCSPVALGGLGFHSTLTWRAPLRARLAWDLLKPGASLFQRVFRSRYPQGFGPGPARRGDSFVLRLLMDGMEALHPLIRWRVGGGLQVNTLTDAWIFETPLSRWPTLFAGHDLDGLLVADLLDGEGRWDRDKLARHFAPDLIDIILRLPRARHTEEDVPELSTRFSGRTTTSLAYNVRFSPPGECFRWLSRLRLHPRERFFWWRMAWGAIPTRSWLARRGLTEDRSCPWGCLAEESANHILGECEFLQKTSRALLRWGVSLPACASWEAFRKLCERMDRGVFEATRALCYTVYQCWRSRNAKCHGQEFATPLVIAANVLTSLSYGSFHSSQGNWGTSQPDRLSPSTLWCPPPPGWIKINIDGAVGCNREAGLGLVIRDSEGRVLLAAGHSTTHWDPGGAEMAALKVLGEFLPPSFFAVAGALIEGDCSNMIDYCRRSTANGGGSWDVRDADGLEFLREFAQISFQLVRRSANRAADVCSKLAIVSPFVWFDASRYHPEFLEIVQEDLAGILPFA